MFTWFFEHWTLEYIEYSICQLRKKCQRYRNCERNKVFPSLNGFALKRFVEWLVQAKWKCEKKIWMHFYIYLFPLQIQKANRQEKKAINCIIPSKCGFVNLKKRKISQNGKTVLKYYLWKLRIEWSNWWNTRGFESVKIYSHSHLKEEINGKCVLLCYSPAIDKSRTKSQRTISNHQSFAMSMANNLLYSLSFGCFHLIPSFRFVQPNPCGMPNRMP